jgi:ADP-glucose pyrophosphorylase
MYGPVGRLGSASNLGAYRAYRAPSHDFGHNILPGILGRCKISAYNFVDENKQNALSWRDVATLEAYFDP